MNPYLIIGALVALFAVGGAGFVAGDHYGTDSQKVADQAQFDKINAKITAQKAEANQLYQKAQDDIIALQLERDAFKTKLEKEHVANQRVTDDLRTKYAGLSLRYGTQSAGDRADGTGTCGTQSNAASVVGTTVVQLPSQITSDLRQLVVDADHLKDDYVECYNYAEQVK